jgi:ABC-type branched-subunit amino acid transport system ATPase component/branched-subunit amino acid ABC-type transport system permease component
MHEFLPFIVIGLSTGAVYGLAGMGLVLTYKTSGILNFGYGAVAALVAFLFYFLHQEHGMPWLAAAVISVLVFAPLLGLVLELLARSLHDASETVKVVATVGLILIVEGLSVLWHPENPPTFNHFLPQKTVRILSVNVTWEQIILFGFSAAAAVVLYWFFRAVRLGIVMRGVVDNADLVAMSGDDPVRVRRWAWVIGTVFSGVAGVMLAGSQRLDGVTLATAVFAAFGAAAIGCFTNLPLTFAGGLLVGIASALIDKYSATVTWIGGLAPALPFVILFLVLIFVPRRYLIQRRLARTMRTRPSYQAPARVRLSAGGLVIVVLALIPTIQSGRVVLWSAALIDVLLFLSLGLLVRRSGQISLCHITLAAVGAAAFGHFATNDGIPWLLAVVLATLVAIPVGAVVAIPAVRVSGVFLALATLGFGILVQQVFYTRSFMFGASTLGIAAPRPHVSIGGWNLATDKGFYYLLLVITVLVVFGLIMVGRGRLGRLLEAMSDSPLALETHGATSSVLKVIVFCLSAAIASFAGALTAMLYHVAVGDYFVPFNSLVLVVLVVIVAGGEPWYALIAAIGYTVIPSYITGQNTTSVLNIVFGLSAATAAWSLQATTMPEAVKSWLDRLGGRRVGATSAATAVTPTPLRLGWSGRSASERTGLVVRGLHIRFGGVKAVEGVSLEAPMGRITALIGPNGAGKTTIFNACSGLKRPSSGQVVLHSDDVSGGGPAQRARQGLGRTFQRTELFDTLTVRQNVAMGREAPLAGSNPLSQMFSSAQARREVAAATERALELTGLTAIADVQAGLLPSGQRRLVELARTLAGPFDVLLLDEPSSGLDGQETERFGEVLRTVTRERACAVLIVEHDMTLVRAICDYVYVLDFGIPIFEGTPDEMDRCEPVRAAYLGNEVPALRTEV